MTPVADANWYATELATELVERSNILPEQAAKMLTADVGQTPSDVIYEENKLRVHKYEPETVEHETPLVLVYALINKPYILDLQPGASVIETLLNEGFEVYLVDWGEPSRLDQSLTFEDYVCRYLDNCIEEVCTEADVEDVHLLGYCMGGTMALMYTALYEENVRTLGALALAFSFDGDSGIFETWAEGMDIDTAVDTVGNLPKRPMAVAFTMTDPVDNYVTRWLDLWDRLDDDGFVQLYARIEQWSWDGVDITGGAFREFVGDMVQDNKLAENEFSLGEKHIDVTDIEVPVVQIIGGQDTIAPPESSKPLADVISSDEYQEFEFPSGHFGVSMSPGAHQELWPDVADWFASHDAASDADAPDDGTVEATGDSTNGHSDAAETLSGIGPTYAKRLNEAGIESVGDLAECGAEELANIAQTSSSRTAEWLDQATD